jgi:hypothetical protein
MSTISPVNQGSSAYPPEHVKPATPAAHKPAMTKPQAATDTVQLSSEAKAAMEKSNPTPANSAHSRKTQKA